MPSTPSTIMRLPAARVAWLAHEGADASRAREATKGVTARPVAIATDVHARASCRDLLVERALCGLNSGLPSM